MNNIREIRIRNRLTMADLGKMVGVTEAAISNYELGKRKASYELLLKIAEALDCSVEDLMRNEKKPTANSDELPDDIAELIFKLRKADPVLRKAAIASALAVLSSDSKD